MYQLYGQKFVLVSMDHPLAGTPNADVVLNTLDNFEMIFDFTDRINDPSSPMGGICIKTFSNWTFEKTMPVVMTKLRPNEMMVL